MADFERLKLRGLLEEKRHEASRLRLKCEYLRDSIRDYLPRHEKIDFVRGDIVATQAVELAASLVQLNDLNVRIRAIEKDLGE